MRAFLMVLDDGIVADMVVLERDILAAPMEEIKDIGVVTTIVDGKIVFQK
jgi:predicted amidohydrolase YtcJ